MPKRTSGMPRFTAEQLHQRADQLERQISDPGNTDDPRWLRRWADRLRRLATKKEAAADHKREQRP